MVSLLATIHAKVKLSGDSDVTDLKEEIFARCRTIFQGYDAIELILKAKRSDENDDQATLLENPEGNNQSTCSERFGVEL